MSPRTRIDAVTTRAQLVVVIMAASTLLPSAALVRAVFVPQSFAKRRILFLHGRLAELASHDVVIATVADIRGDATVVVCRRGVTVDRASRRSGGGIVGRSVRRSARASGHLGRLFLRFGIFTAAVRALFSSGETTASSSSATTARIGGGFFAALVEDCLFFENETVELAKRFIELAVEPGTPLFRSFRATGRCARGRCFCAGLSLRFTAYLTAHLGLFARGVGFFSWLTGGLGKRWCFRGWHLCW